jgi:hypothetical protein
MKVVPGAVLLVGGFSGTRYGMNPTREIRDMLLPNKGGVVEF